MKFVNLIVFFGFLFNICFLRLGFAEDVRDIKPPILLPQNKMWFVLSAVILIVLIIIGVWWYCRKYRALRTEDREAPKPAWEAAFLALKQLSRTDLLSKGEYKEYFSRLSDIIRKYFERRFHIRAPEMTTEEFMHMLKKSERLTLKQKDILKEFLHLCDLVKFAKHLPSSKEVEEVTKVAFRLIEETKELSVMADEVSTK